MFMTCIRILIRIRIHFFQCGSMIWIRIKVKWILSTSAKDPDPLDSQDFDFLDLDPDPDPDKGAKYQHKTEERKMLLSNAKFVHLKNWYYKITWFLNGSHSFSIKISQKIRQQIWKICFVKKFSKFCGNNMDTDTFFSSADPGSESRSVSKLNGS